MKKIILLVLVFVLCLTGCNNKITYVLPHDQFCYSANNSQVIEINADDRQLIIDLLNEASWTNDFGNCHSDFIFYTQKEEIKYHSACGTFTDYTNEQCTTVSEEQRIAVNAILGIN